MKKKFVVVVTPSFSKRGAWQKNQKPGNSLRYGPQVVHEKGVVIEVVLGR